MEERADHSVEMKPAESPGLARSDGGRNDLEDIPENMNPFASPESISPSPDPNSKSKSFAFDSFDYPESEGAQSKLITEALQQEDEFMEYLMSLPVSQKIQEVPRERQRSSSCKPGSILPIITSSSRTSNAKVGLDHLDNLCKLMEQLGDLREQNSKLQRRVQYLEDLKNLQEMHKELQETMQNKQQERVELPSYLTAHRASVLPTVGPPQSLLPEAMPLKRHGSEESLPKTNAQPKRGSKTKSHLRIRSSLAKQRERSKSVGYDEIKTETENIVEDKGPQEQPQKQQSRPTSLIKSKVSKWTKVKEAFRWEKAQIESPRSDSRCTTERTSTNSQDVSLPESKSQDSGIGLGHLPEESGSRFLKVPGTPDKGDLSVSPADSVLSGHSFTFPTYSCPISSSSSSDDFTMDVDLNFAAFADVTDFGPQRSASATDSTGDKLLHHSSQRRHSLTHSHDDEACRRSKSLECEECARNCSKHTEKDGSLKKSHKTPWGKVKNIIQTRKDSLKKRQRKGEAETATGSDHDDDCDFAEAVDGVEHGVTDQVDAGRTHQRPRIEVSSQPETKDRRKDSQKHLSKSPREPDTDKAGKRLTPTLTVTLPSTEELTRVPEAAHGGGRKAKPPPSPLSEERLRLEHRKQAAASSPTEDGSDHAVVKSRRQLQEQISLTKPSSSSAGTSPPAHRRPSKWIKVKKAFLTSRKEDEGTVVRASNSVPSSPNRNSVFHYDVNDDLAEGDKYGKEPEDARTWQKKADEHVKEEMHQRGEQETAEQASHPSSLHAEIQKSYEELQQKLSLEFHKKLHEWEKMKGGASRSSQRGDDIHDKDFKKKMEEWEKMKSAGRSNRDSVAQTLDEENLSPGFKKKLQEWERMKSSSKPDEEARNVPSSSRGAPQTVAEENLPPEFRKRLVEWQLWRAVAGKSDQNVEELQKILPEEFNKKLQEWERMKAEAGGPCSQGSAAPNASPNMSAAKAPSPRISRKDSGSKTKKSKSRDGLDKEREAKAKPQKEKHKEKELQWLEKELHKIEREKQRLEREREKYLEREARLERMKQAMGQPQKKQEILIQTSTGFFRFEGISEKFTKKLYEWEQQRGIGPEASTFALLDPKYRQAAQCTEVGNRLTESARVRSKSESSVAELVVSGAPSHPSSLSLNDVDALDQQSPGLEESRAASEPRLRTDSQSRAATEEQPSAVIVDVEDVIEESATLVAIPAVKTETPVYSYAPAEVTRLIDSSGSESDKEPGALKKSDSVKTDSSYKLIEENMNLLTKLKDKENICRKLENEIENLEGQISDVAKSHQEELENLRKQETGLDDTNPEQQPSRSDLDTHQRDLIERLKKKLKELESFQEQLQKEGIALQDSFQQQSQQQVALAKNLVGKMKQLQEANITAVSAETEELKPNPETLLSTFSGDEAVSHVQQLSTELLKLAEKLEIALAERNREIHSLRFELEDQRKKRDFLPGRTGARRATHARHWSSADGMSISMGSLQVPDATLRDHSERLPRQSSEELAELPFLLTNKVLELKRGLTILCSKTDTEIESMEESPGQDQNVASTENTQSPPKSSRPGSSCEDQQQGTASKEDAEASKNDERDETSQRDVDSPVTCVTITPRFWKRDSIQSSRQQEATLSPPSEVREKYCAMMSSSSSSEDEDDDEEDELELGEGSTDESNRSSDTDEEAYDDTYQKEQDAEDIVVFTVKTRRKSSDAISTPASERTRSPSVVSSADEANGIDEGVGDESGERKDEVVPETEVTLSFPVRTAKISSIRVDSEKHVGDNSPTTITCAPWRKTRTDSPNEEKDVHESQATKLEIVRKEPDSADYSTTVICIKPTGTDDLKLRRISDTHIAYSEGKCYPKSSKTSTEKEVNREEKEIATSSSEDTIVAMNEEESVTKCTKDDSSPVSDLSRISPNKSSARLNEKVKTQNSSETGCKQNPVNIFVPTTRRIFSPVHHDSKGKASSVIGYVVESDSQRQEAVRPDVTPPPWRRKASSEMDTQETGNSVPKGVVPWRRNSRTRDSQSASPAFPRKQMEQPIVPRTPPSVRSKFPLLESGNVKHGQSLSDLKSSTLVSANTCEGSGETTDGSRTRTGSSVPETPSTPSSTGLPPFPQPSPTPSRRDFFKIAAKEAAPSVKLMIARYNQKLNEEAANRSPELRSPSRSPAWRSPVAERKESYGFGVRAQMEKYQEEVRKALQAGKDKNGRFLEQEPMGSSVQKSASTGIIKSAVNTLKPSILGILKSSSAGAIKPHHEPEEEKIEQPAESREEIEGAEAAISKGNTEGPNPLLPLDESLDQTILSYRNRRPAPKSPAQSQTNPPSKLRALKIQKAKEEFLSRGPGGQSWSGESTSKAEQVLRRTVSSVPEAGCSRIETEDSAREPDSSKRESFCENGARSRLSQVSIGSESSYDDVLLLKDGLIKSASAGMINMEHISCRRVTSVESGSSAERGLIHSSSHGTSLVKPQSSSSRFGFLSRFRKVKMRKKDKMNTVSMLCRQSLLVDIHLGASGGASGSNAGSSNQNSEASTSHQVESGSRSCPSSPVLRPKKTDGGGSWIRNPKKIFKPK